MASDPSLLDFLLFRSGMLPLSSAVRHMEVRAEVASIRSPLSDRIPRTGRDPVPQMRRSLAGYRGHLLIKEEVILLKLR